MPIHDCKHLLASDSCRCQAVLISGCKSMASAREHDCVDCGGLQGDDYVLYCHPSRQKTPKAEKLRDWYHSLLDKAELRGLVMFRSTMFDTFLPGGKDHAMMEPTTRMLPYFDGDFWPGEAEAQLLEIEKGASSNSVTLPNYMCF